MANYCECGCGTEIKQNRMFVSGHNSRVENYCKGQFQKGEKRPKGFNQKKEKIQDLCLCGCYEKTTPGSKLIRGHNFRINNPNPKKIRIQRMCLCGCGKLTSPDKKYVNGHNIRGTHINLENAGWSRGKTKKTDKRLIIIGRKISIALTGRKTPPEVVEKRMKTLSEHPIKYKKHLYKSKFGIIINMKSSWEVQYAKYLDSLNLIWRYEPEGFPLGNGHRYFPDFYLSDLNEYHEVKGYMRKSAQEKIELFIQAYPNKTLKIIDEKLMSPILLGEFN